MLEIFLRIADNYEETKLATCLSFPSNLPMNNYEVTPISGYSSLCKLCPSSYIGHDTCLVVKLILIPRSFVQIRVSGIINIRVSKFGDSIQRDALSKLFQMMNTYQKSAWWSLLHFRNFFNVFDFVGLFNFM